MNSEKGNDNWKMGYIGEPGDLLGFIWAARQPDVSAARGGSNEVAAARVDDPIDAWYRCPCCNDAKSHYRNIGRDHWFFCEPCGVRWLIGSNLFSSWRDESEMDWDRNAMFLAQFKAVTL